MYKTKKVASYLLIQSQKDEELINKVNAPRRKPTKTKTSAADKPKI